MSDPTAPIYIQLVGEKGESGRIQMKPGYSPADRFEKGQTYKVVARVSEIGKVGDIGVQRREEIKARYPVAACFHCC